MSTTVPSGFFFFCCTSIVGKYELKCIKLRKWGPLGALKVLFVYGFLGEGCERVEKYKLINNGAGHAGPQIPGN